MTPRTDFRPQEFEVAIEGFGSRLLWEHHEMCPCTIGDDTHNTDCPLCDGRGYYWTTGQEIRGIVNRMSDAPRLYEDFGRFGFGMASISLHWEHAPGHGDRYTVLDGTMLWQERVTRSSADYDRLTFRIGLMTMDVLRGGLPSSVTFGVRKLIAATAAGVGGAALEEGTDFDIYDGCIDWAKGDVLGTAPPVGRRYAVSYYARPRWTVSEHAHALRQTDTQLKSTQQTHGPLPVSVLCKLDWGTQPTDRGGWTPAGVA